MQPISTLAPADNQQIKTRQTHASQLSQFEIIKKAKDVGIIQAHLNQNSEAADSPQRLLLKAAITEINDILAPYIDNKTVQNVYESDIDFSPEATAERIINGASSFFTSFKERNNDLSDEDAASRFKELITKGVEQGFEDARSVLEGLKVLEGKVSEDIQSTYDFVQERLVSLHESLLEQQHKQANQTDEESLVDIDA